VEKKINVYVVHGYTASSDRNWFPWLKSRLEERGIDVTVFDMPHSHAPNAGAWDEWLASHITRCNENTILVGHSLGCIALLRYLNNQPESLKVNGVAFVSGFLEPVPTLPELDSFSKVEIHCEKIIKMAKNRLVIGAANDTIVPYAYTANLSKQLNAKLIHIENGGHFIDKVGCTELPALLDELNKMTE